MGGGWRYPSPSAPAPVAIQRRAAETIRAAIEATVTLLERLPEQQVTLDAIRRRSGVSQGSLTHHFGSREGLVATAHVERYARGCAADAAFFGQLEGRVSAAETFAGTMVRLIADMLSPERRTARWVRLSAIAAAYGDPELAATIGHAYTALADRLTALVDEAHRHGLLLADVDPRTVALLLSMQAQGLVLDDLVDAEVAVSSWHRLQVRFVSSFLTPAAAAAVVSEERDRFGELWRAETFGAPGRVPSEVAQRLATLRGDAGRGRDRALEVDEVRALIRTAEQGQAPGRPDPQRASGTPMREDVLALASVQVRAGGEAAVDVHAIRRRTGISPQSFHRLFGGRDALVRAARVRVEVERSAASIARFSQLVVAAEDAAAMRAGLTAGGVRMAEDAHRAAIWQRIETLSATLTDHDLRMSLAAVQRVTRDLLVEEVCDAQLRGLIDPTLPAQSVARLLDGTVFWHVFHGLDARAPDRGTWVAMLGRVAALLSPDR